ncbi:MAG TPA: metallophosphoesterase family protein [Thermomicrobiales bacterium]|nr:metallophosphoesterase family protein [Thermomicrobiales bacterium]
MTTHTTATPPSDKGSPAGQRAWLRRVLIGLVILLLTGIAGFGALVEFADYCESDFLPFEESISAEPYVQNVSSNAATVMWRTEERTDGYVVFGTAGEADRTVASDSSTVHAVRLANLRPDTEYVYEVRSGESVYDSATFNTAPGPDGEVTAIVVGDTGSGEPPQYEVAEVMMDINADLLLHTGDVVYPHGGTCRYEERYYAPYREMIESVPVYPVLGNHDVRTDNGEPYLTAFELPAESSGTERYYSFDYGPLHVAALDSELYYNDDTIPTERQKAWLREDLAASDRPWKVVIIHRPPYSSSPFHGGDRQILEDLVAIFEEEEVDVVFAGHEHVYERLVPIDGVTYFVTGGGGADLRSAGRSDLTAVSSLRYHALEVKASPERVLINAVGIDGEVFDTIELTQPDPSVVTPVRPPG